MANSYRPDGKKKKKRRKGGGVERSTGEGELKGVPLKGGGEWGKLHPVEGIATGTKEGKRG